MPKVSVVIPNYNHARFLRKRIDSVLQQTFQDFEVILLDDCSTDDSRSILSSYAGDPRVRIEFNDVNSGNTFKQWNKGVRLAHGEYVWIAESDDYADERLLERLVPVLDSKTDVVYVSCRSWVVNGADRLEGYADSCAVELARYAWGTDVDGREECRNYFVRVNPVCNASSVLFRRSVYESVGAADESLRLCGDWKVWAAMALTGRVMYINEALNYFRCHDGSVRSKTGSMNLDALEYLTVMGWVLDQVTPSQAILKKLGEPVAGIWVPTVMSTHVSAQVKRAILKRVREVDPYAFRNALRPALNTIRLKLLRHWNSLRPGSQ